MKKAQLIIAITFSFLFITSSSFAQTMSSFFKYDGVRTLAGLAHPMGTYEKGSYDINTNYIDVSIKYTDGTITQLRIGRYKNAFTGIKVIYDNDFSLHLQEF